MLKDGTVERARPEDGICGDLAGEAWIWRRSTAAAYRGKGVPDALSATVWAKDEAHAVKITNEHRTQMIASGQWQ